MYLCDRIEEVYNMLRSKVLCYLAVGFVVGVFGLGALRGAFGTTACILIMLLCVVVAVLGVTRFVAYAFLLDSYRSAMLSTEFERIAHYVDRRLFGRLALNVLSTMYGDVEYYEFWYKGCRAVLPIPIVKGYED